MKKKNLLILLLIPFIISLLGIVTVNITFDTIENDIEGISWNYSDAEKIVLVMDNLNTHTTASFYKVFSPEEAFRLTQKLEIHYTPKHGSWLDIAEIELSALTIQCLLGERIPSLDKLNDILSGWNLKRNSTQKGVSWHFTTADARIKLKHLYPEIKF